MKLFFRVVSIIILFIALFSCDRAKLTGIEFDKIDISQDPGLIPSFFFSFLFNSSLLYRLLIKPKIAS